MPAPLSAPLPRLSTIDAAAPPGAPLLAPMRPIRPLHPLHPPERRPHPRPPPRPRPRTPASEALTSASPNMVFNPSAANGPRGWTHLSRARWKPHLSATPPPGTRSNFVAATAPMQWACMAQPIALSAFTHAPGRLRVEVSARFRAAAPVGPAPHPRFQFAAVLYDGACNVLAHHCDDERAAPSDRWLRVRHAFEPQDAARFVLIVVSGEGGPADPRVLRGTRVACVSARLLCDLTNDADPSTGHGCLLPEAFSNLGDLTVGPPRVVRAYVDAQRRQDIPDHVRQRLTHVPLRDGPSTTPASAMHDMLLRDTSLDGGAPPTLGVVSFPSQGAAAADAGGDDDDDDGTNSDIFPPSSFDTTDLRTEGDDDDAQDMAGMPPPPPPDPLLMRTATDEVVNFGYWSVPASSGANRPAHPAGPLASVDDDVLANSSAINSRDDVPAPAWEDAAAPHADKQPGITSRARAWTRRIGQDQQLLPAPLTLPKRAVSPPAPPVEDIAGFSSAIESRDDVTRGLEDDDDDDDDDDDRDGAELGRNDGAESDDGAAMLRRGGSAARARRDPPRSPRTPRTSLAPRSPRSPRSPWTPRGNRAKAAAAAAMSKLRSLKPNRPRREQTRDTAQQAEVVVRKNSEPGIAPPPVSNALMRAKSAQANLGLLASEDAPPGISAHSGGLGDADEKDMDEEEGAYPISPVTPHVGADGDAKPDGDDDGLAEHAEVVTLPAEEEAGDGVSEGDLPQMNEPRSSDAGSAGTDGLPVRTSDIDLSADADEHVEEEELVVEDSVDEDDGTNDDNLSDEEVVLHWLSRLEKRLGSVSGVQLVSPNMVANPSGKDGVSGWKNISTDRWTTEMSEEPCCNSRVNFVAKRAGCSMVYPVDLARCIRSPGRVGLEVSARFRSRPGVPAMFCLRAALYDSEGKELAFRDGTDVVAPDDRWEVANVLFAPTPGARFAFIFVSGVDKNGVRFGTKVVECCVRALQPLEAGRLDSLLPPQVPAQLTDDASVAMRSAVSSYARHSGVLFPRISSSSLESEGDDNASGGIGDPNSTSGTGDTTSRTSSVGELGRLFLGRYAGLRVVSPNLLYNPFAHDGLVGWTNLDDGDGWCAEKAGMPFETRCTNFVSARARCALAQQVDLARFVSNPATAALTVLTHFRARNEAGTRGGLRVRAVVLDARARPLEAFDSGEMEPASGRWATVQLDLPPVGHARFVIVALVARGGGGVRIAECALRATCDPLYGAKRNMLVRRGVSDITKADVAPCELLQVLRADGLVRTESIQSAGNTIVDIGSTNGSLASIFNKTTVSRKSSGRSKRKVNASFKEGAEICEEDIEEVVRVESGVKLMSDDDIMDIQTIEEVTSLDGGTSEEKAGRKSMNGTRDEEAISEASSIVERIETGSLMYAADGSPELSSDRDALILGFVPGRGEMSPSDEWFGPFSRRRCSSGDMLFNGGAELGLRGWTSLDWAGDARWRVGTYAAGAPGSAKVSCFVSGRGAGGSAMGQGVDVERFVRGAGGVSYLIAAKFRGRQRGATLRIVAGVLNEEGETKQVFDSGVVAARPDGRWANVKHVFGPRHGARYVVVAVQGSGGIQMRGCSVCAMYYGRHDGEQTVMEERFGALNESDVVQDIFVQRFARRHLTDRSSTDRKLLEGHEEDEEDDERHGNLVVNARGRDALRSWVHVSEGTWQGAPGGGGFQATRRWCAMCQAVDLQRAVGVDGGTVKSDRAFVEVSARVRGGKDGGGRFRLEAALLDERQRELKRVRGADIAVVASASMRPRIVCEPVSGTRFAVVVVAGRTGEARGEEVHVDVGGVAVRVFDGDPDSVGGRAVATARPPNHGVEPRLSTERAVRQLFGSGQPA